MKSNREYYGSKNLKWETKKIDNHTYVMEVSYCCKHNSEPICLIRWTISSPEDFKELSSNWLFDSVKLVEYEDPLFWKYKHYRCRWKHSPEITDEQFEAILQKLRKEY